MRIAVGTIRRKVTFLCLVLFAVVSSPAFVQELDAQQLTDLDIEQLSRVKVTSAGKREQSLNDVSSAIFVISKEDIRRSTATSIPELLRFVPGLHVAQVNAHTWNITCRGLGGVFSNKLLVLMDGRTLYTPLFRYVLECARLSSWGYRAYRSNSWCRRNVLGL